MEKKKVTLSKEEGNKIPKLVSNINSMFMKLLSKYDLSQDADLVNRSLLKRIYIQFQPEDVPDVKAYKMKMNEDVDAAYEKIKSKFSNELNKYSFIKISIKKGKNSTSIDINADGAIYESYMFDNTKFI